MRVPFFTAFLDDSAPDSAVTLMREMVFHMGFVHWGLALNQDNPLHLPLIEAFLNNPCVNPCHQVRWITEGPSAETDLVGTISVTALDDLFTKEMIEKSIGQVPCAQAMSVLGPDLQSHVKQVLCYGQPSGQGQGILGQYAQTVDLAREREIPIMNLFYPEQQERATAFIESSKKRTQQWLYMG